MKKLLWLLSGVLSVVLLTFCHSSDTFAMSAVIANDYDLFFTTASGSFKIAPYINCNIMGNSFPELSNAPITSGSSRTAVISVYVGGSCTQGGNAFGFPKNGLITFGIITKNISLLSTEWVANYARIIDINLLGNQGELSYWEVTMYNGYGADAQMADFPLRLTYTGVSPTTDVTPYLTIQSLTVWKPKDGVDLSSLESKVNNIASSLDTVNSSVNSAISSINSVNWQVQHQGQQAHDDSQAQINTMNKNSQAEVDATNKQTQQQQEQYEQDKQEEQDRENQGSEDADKAAGIFNFHLVNPFEPLFALFRSPDSCASIPTLARWVHSETTTVCSWWSADVRTTLTPVFGIASIMILFGFFIRWLGGNEYIDVGVAK